ncbi:MAG: hypothetical protein MZV64_59995 [Ignavibacteriales bacterium]|nr:hypothetical protein [Ignavibacteriales bacterium]
MLAEVKLARGDLRPGVRVDAGVEGGDRGVQINGAQEASNVMRERAEAIGQRGCYG